MSEVSSGEAAPSAFSEVVTGGSLLFLSSLISSLSGLIFWLIVSRALGVEAVGTVSALVSASGMATALATSGFLIAVLREFAGGGLKAWKPALLASLTLGLASAALAYGFTLKLPATLTSLAWFPMLLALTTTVSYVPLQALIGLGYFKDYFKASALASIAKLALGLTALAGAGLLAPIAGYLAFPLAGLAAASAYLLTKIKNSREEDSSLTHISSNLKSILKLTYSNYPYLLSSSITVVLSVYGFAIATGELFNTGVLYLSLMIVLVITSIFDALLRASLSVGVRRSYDPFTNALRIGLGASTPIASAVSAAPIIPLVILNPQLTTGKLTLTILALSVPPTATVTAAIMKLNKEKKQKTLAAIGSLRLLTLVAALIPAVKMGTAGVAAAYLLSNTAPLPLALRELPRSTRHLAAYWTAQIAVTVAAITLLPQQTLTQAIVLAALAALATLAVGHMTRILTIKELTQTLKLAIRSVT